MTGNNLERLCNYRFKAKYFQKVIYQVLKDKTIDILLKIKGIAHPKILICWKFTHPPANFVEKCILDRHL